MLVADEVANVLAKLLGYAACHGNSCQAAWLGTADHTALTASGEQGDLGQLGGFAGASIAADHSDLMFTQGTLDSGCMGSNREFGWQGKSWSILVHIRCIKIHRWGCGVYIILIIDMQ